MTTTGQLDPKLFSAGAIADSNLPSTGSVIAASDGTQLNNSGRSNDSGAETVS